MENGFSSKANNPVYKRDYCFEAKTRSFGVSISQIFKDMYKTSADDKPYLDQL
jgi:hypothetical protein